MKELEHCSECDSRLKEPEKEHNRDIGVDAEAWLCWRCEIAADPES